MNLQKTKLWKVPMYCLVANVVSYAIIMLTARLEVGWGLTSSLLLFLSLFVLGILVGGLFVFRKMTRKEIFYSATIVVGFQLVFTLLKVFGVMEMGVTNLWWYIISNMEWTRFPELLLAFINIRFGVVMMFLGDFVPYLFVFFGKKES